MREQSCRVFLFRQFVPKSATAAPRTHVVGCVGVVIKNAAELSHCGMRRQSFPTAHFGQLLNQLKIFSPIEERIRILTRPNQLCGAIRAHKIAPRAVPDVFVMRSVMPESRVGRNACKTSIVRLTANPRAIVTTTACFVLRTEEKYAYRTKPNGTKPTMLTPTFLQ